MSKTLAQITNHDGWPKARELIEFAGHHFLEANDRALLNTLYQIAHDSGRMTQKDAEWTVSLPQLRPSKHESSDRLRLSLDRLLSVIVTVPYLALGTNEERYLKTHLFDFFDTSANEGTAAATLRFGLPKELQPVLAQSGKWGRIRAEIVHAMTSKYAIAVYELVQARANLERCVETIPLDKFRSLIGVPPGKLVRGPDFQRRALEPAVLEVNGLSDVGVALAVVRKSPKNPLSPIVAVSMAWWKKQGEEYRETMRERVRSKVGRMARLKGTVETIEDIPFLGPKGD
jgi:hypothetical protein